MDGGTMFSLAVIFFFFCSVLKIVSISGQSQKHNSIAVRFTQHTTPTSKKMVLCSIFHYWCSEPCKITVRASRSGIPKLAPPTPVNKEVTRWWYMRENALGVLWYTVVFMIICFLHELVFHYKLSSYRRRENRRYVHATDVCVYILCID